MASCAGSYAFSGEGIQQRRWAASNQICCLYATIAHVPGRQVVAMLTYHCNTWSGSLYSVTDSVVRQTQHSHTMLWWTAVSKPAYGLISGYRMKASSGTSSSITLFESLAKRTDAATTTCTASCTLGHVCSNCLKRHCVLNTPHCIQHTPRISSFAQLFVFFLS